MSLFSKLNFVKRRPMSSLLGLALDGNHLEGAVVLQQNGALKLAQTFTATLALDPLTNEPELVGREILNHLEAAGIRQRCCVVAVPLKWALTTQTSIPPIPEADVAGFLQIESERGFPCDVATLRVAASRSKVPPGQDQTTLVGIPAGHLERLEQALRAARLKPLSFAPGITALQLPSDVRFNGVLALVLGEDQASLQVTCGGGVAALRVLDGVLETNTSQPTVHADLVARETRITLGQLAPECRAAVKRIRIFGPPGLVRQLATEMSPHFESPELSVERVTQYLPSEFGVPIPAGVAVSMAFSLAARFLTGHICCLEFLPPYIPPWKRLARQCASGKLQAAGAVAAALLVLASGVFGIQQWLLLSLSAQWEKMSATAGELETVQQQIQQYRPWFDESLTSLTIMRELTLAFPEDGSVTAKTVEIRNQSAVSCAGTARDHAAFLQALARVRAAEGVHDVKVEQIRGKTPLQFTFAFQYGTETSHEN